MNPPENRLRLLGPASKFHRESNSKLGELQHVGEAELVGNIDATAGVWRSANIHDGYHTELTYSLTEWIFLLEFSNELSERKIRFSVRLDASVGQDSPMVKLDGYPALRQEALQGHSICITQAGIWGLLTGRYKRSRT